MKMESQIDEIRLVVGLLLEDAIFAQKELYRITVTQTAILSALCKKFPELDGEIKRAQNTVKRMMGKDTHEMIKLLRKEQRNWPASKTSRSRKGRA